MALVTVTGKEAEGGGNFKKVTAGRKIAAVVGANHRQSNAGNPMAEIFLIVLKDLSEKGEEGGIISDYITFTENAKWKLAQVIASMEDSKEGAALRANPDAQVAIEDEQHFLRVLQAGPFVIDVTEEQYEFKPSYKVTGYELLKDGVKSSQLEGVNLQGAFQYGTAQVQKLLTARAKAAAEKGGNSNAGNTAGGGWGGGGGESPPYQDSDIPF